MLLNKIFRYLLLCIYSINLNPTTPQEIIQEAIDSFTVYWSDILISIECPCTDCLTEVINRNMISDYNNKCGRTIEMLSIAEVLGRNINPIFFTDLVNIKWEVYMNENFPKPPHPFDLS